jgi:hypothetical protein
MVIVMFLAGLLLGFTGTFLMSVKHRRLNLGELKEVLVSRRPASRR